MVKEGTRNGEAPERSLSGKLPPSLGLRTKPGGCVTGTLWETGQEGGLLGGSCGRGGVQSEPQNQDKAER